MTSRAIVITILLTAAGVVLLVWNLGPGGLLYPAMLGGAAVWLLPGPFALALPAGAFGGVLLARTGWEAVADDGSTRDTLRFAVLALLVSALTVGWLVPLAYQETDWAISQFQRDSLPVEQTQVKPERLTLDQLVAGMGSVPGAGQDLLRRAAWTAPSFLAPLFGGVLVRIRKRWTRDEVAVATLVIYVISVRLAMGSVV